MTTIDYAFIVLFLVPFAWWHWEVWHAPLNDDMEPEEEELWKDLH